MVGMRDVGNMMASGIENGRVTLMLEGASRSKESADRSAPGSA